MKYPLARQVAGAAKDIVHEKSHSRRLRRETAAALAPRVHDVRTGALRYVRSLEVEGRSTGTYRYRSRPGDPAILYASVFAALLRHLFEDLNEVEESRKGDWITLINSYQCPDGLFRDNIVANDIAEDEDWWGWRHVTLLSLMALHALGGKPRYELTYLEELDSRAKVARWCAHQDWGRSVSFTSNRVQNFGAAMQYARDILGYSTLTSAIDSLLDETAARCAPSTGIWGAESLRSKQSLSEGVQAGYHFWLLFFWERRDIPYPDQALRSLMALQSDIGSFAGRGLASSACEDIDAVDPMIRLSYAFPPFRTDIEARVRRAATWVGLNFNKDGGATFKRGTDFRYGHDLMYSQEGESSIFATWFRSLTLALCWEFLGEVNDRDWKFLDCPGLQFFKTARS